MLFTGTGVSRQPVLSTEDLVSIRKGKCLPFDFDADIEHEAMSPTDPEADTWAASHNRTPFRVAWEDSDPNSKDPFFTPVWGFHEACRELAETTWCSGKIWKLYGDKYVEMDDEDMLCEEGVAVPTLGNSVW